MTRLLFIDDDLAYSRFVKEFLETQGHEVDWYPHSKTGMDAFQKGKYDLCLLDVKMPHIDGFSVAEEIQKIDPGIPFIFLTGVSEKSKKLQGFRLGADDYITKPFSLELLNARVKAVLRRYQSQQNQDSPTKNDFRIGGFVFEEATRQLIHSNLTVLLTAKEAGILILLVSRQNQLVTRENILKNVWGNDDFFKGMSLNVYISKLRKYLKEDPNIQILTVRGEGYKLTLRQ